MSKFQCLSVFFSSFSQITAYMTFASTLLLDPHLKTTFFVCLIKVSVTLIFAITNGYITLIVTRHLMWKRLSCRYLYLLLTLLLVTQGKGSCLCPKRKLSGRDSSGLIMDTFCLYCCFCYVDN